MVPKRRLLVLPALGAALLFWQHSSLYAQGNYDPSHDLNFTVSPLPVHVGESVTLTVTAPSIVALQPEAGVEIYPGSSYNGDYSEITFLPKVDLSTGKAVIQVPAFTTPGEYTISVGSTLSSGQVSLFVSSASQAPDPLLTFTGQYSFLFQGQTGTAPSGTPGAAQGLVAAGSFTADGQGNITAGTLDLNGPGILLQGTAVKGTYTLDAGGNGAALLSTPKGDVSFHFVAPPAPGLPVKSGAIVSSGGVTGSGTIAQVGNFLDYSYFYYPGVPTISSAVELSEEPSTQSGFLEEAGQLTFTQVLTQDIYDRSGTVASTGLTSPGAPPSPFLGLTGTYTTPDPITGRFTMTLSGPGQPSTTPSHYAVYQIVLAASQASDAPAATLYFVSLDPHSTATLIAGKAVR